MPNPNIIRVAAVALGAAACAAPGVEAREAVAGGEIAAVHQALERIDRRWEQAANRGDAAGVAALYTDNAYLLPPNAEIAQGTDEIRRVLQAYIDLGLGNVRFTRVHVNVSGDLAYEVGRYSLEIAPQGQRITDNGKYIIVAERQPDGGWKLVADIFNSSEPPAGVQ